MDPINFLAVTMGFMSSFHCVGMCGPIALALPISRGTRLRQLAGISFYNIGRVIIYSILGLVLGTVGSALLWIGYLRYLSILTGAVMIAYVFWPSHINPFLHVPKFWSGTIKRIKTGMGQMLKNHSIDSILILGMLNGLLPCGLVYLALISSVATGNVVGSGIYMLFFGLGTLPAMMAVGFFRQWFTPVLRSRVRQLTPVMLCLAGAWLVVRGIMIQFPTPNSGPNQQITICHGK